MAQFIKKPQEVEAMQYNGDGNIEPIREFINWDSPIRMNNGDNGLIDLTIENCGVHMGISLLEANSWVVKDADENFWTMTDEEFKKAYSPVL